jgi:GDP-4-dehydro-6-deoxy-D-mannose reductase
MTFNQELISSDILITGDTGFVGRHAIASWPTAYGLSSLNAGTDIRDKEALLKCLRQRPPSTVLHLAALSFVPDSFRSPETTFEVNFLGTLRLLEALAETGFVGRFLFVGTGDAYGTVAPEALPIREFLPLRPRNPYSVSKAAAEALCYQWSQTGPFEIVMARPFNHLGPGQATTFVISNFARQLVEISRGRREPVLRTGNLDVTRDFTDVSDVLEAYARLLRSGHPGEAYNICSSVERSIRSLLDKLIEVSGVAVKVTTDASRFRPAEQLRVCGNHDKLTQHTGWRPEKSIDETLMNIFSYWEHQIGT